MSKDYEIDMTCKFKVSVRSDFERTPSEIYALIKQYNFNVSGKDFDIHSLQFKAIQSFDSCKLKALTGKEDNDNG